MVAMWQKTAIYKSTQNIYCYRTVHQNINIIITSYKPICMKESANTIFDKRREMLLLEQKMRRLEIFEKTRTMFEQNTTSNQRSSSEQHSHFNQETYGKQEQGQELAHSMINQQEDEENHLLQTSKEHKIFLKQEKQRRFFGKMLQITEWLNEIPTDLASFYVTARPDGKKVSIHLVRNAIVLRDKCGYQILKIKSWCKSYENIIMEGYYNEQTKIIVISDLIIWKENPMTGNQFEFRIMWLHTNLNLNNFNAKIQKSYHIIFLNYLPCTELNLKHVYTHQSPFYQKEGLTFIQKDSLYNHGLNPNVFTWKDQQTSKYFKQSINQNQLISGCGKSSKSGELLTLDNISISNAVLSEECLKNPYIKFSFRAVQFLINEGEMHQDAVLSELCILSYHSHLNNSIDSLGKLIYKAHLNKQRVTLQKLLQATHQPIQIMNDQ